LSSCAAAHELIDRAQQVLDVDDQHGFAVFHQRARRDVLDLAETAVERLDHQHALAEETVHRHAVGAPFVADHHHRHIGAHFGGRGGAEQLMRGDEADGPAVEGEMLLSLEHVDVTTGQLQRAAHVCERERIGFAAYLRRAGCGSPTA
jgi:hypothetical protein